MMKREVGETPAAMKGELRVAKKATKSKRATRKNAIVMMLMAARNSKNGTPPKSKSTKSGGGAAYNAQGSPLQVAAPPAFNKKFAPTTGRQMKGRSRG